MQNQAFIQLPANQPNAPHRQRDYLIIAYTFVVVVICFLLDSIASQNVQLLLGAAGWFSLLYILKDESLELRAQVLVAVSFATVGEHFASIFMEGYTYRLKNVPAFVPPGHGMVYLTAVVMGRSGFFLRHARELSLAVVFIGGFWSLFALNGIVGRSDQVGTLLFCIYLIYLFKGRSTFVYLGAFYVTTWVELAGTSIGTWHWAAIDPASKLTQGNPPSGVAAWYCLVDAVAIFGGPYFICIYHWLKSEMTAEKQKMD